MNKDIENLHTQAEDFLSANQALLTGERFRLEQAELIARLDLAFRIRDQLNRSCTKAIKDENEIPMGISEATRAISNLDLIIDSYSNNGSMHSEYLEKTVVDGDDFLLSSYGDITPETITFFRNFRTDRALDLSNKEIPPEEIIRIIGTNRKVIADVLHINFKANVSPEDFGWLISNKRFSDFEALDNGHRVGLLWSANELAEVARKETKREGGQSCLTLLAVRDGRSIPHFTQDFSLEGIERLNTWRRKSKIASKDGWMSELIVAEIGKAPPVHLIRGGREDVENAFIRYKKMVDALDDSM